MKKTLIQGGSVVSAENVTKSDVLINTEGRIEKIEPIIVDHRDAEIIDATDCLLFPLLIDCHVHFREPGLTHKATMASEAEAALAGGIGTVCDMPNTVPPTVTIDALKEKVKLASHLEHVRMKFFFGVTEVDHLRELIRLGTDRSIEGKMLRKHCAGVKLYLDHSTGDQKVEERLIGAIFEACAEVQMPIVAHCEDPAINAEAQKKIPSGDVSQHSKRRPPEAEVKAIEKALSYVRISKTHFHVAHLSTREGLELVRKAKKEGLPVTCEVAPHHLFLTTDDYGALGTLGKMNPPLRSLEDRDALWKGIEDGTVDCIATDHAPHTLEEKNVKNPLEAPSGVTGVEMMLPLLLSVAADHWPHPTSARPKSATLTHQDIVRLCSKNPAEIFFIKPDTIERGRPVRMTIVDLEKTWTVERKNLKARCGWSPYEGWSLKGSVIDSMA